jgi:hypothetical protein
VRRDLLALALVVALGACGGGGGAPVALDGSSRVPDDEGLVTAVELDTITIDGARTYEVDDDLVSFSSIDLSTVPLLFTEGQYVQVGVKGSRIRWLGALARPLTTSPARVVFEGTVERVADGQVEFTNGTVLTIDGDVDVHAFEGKRVRVGLRPDRHAVTEVEAT